MKSRTFIAKAGRKLRSLTSSLLIASLLLPANQTRAACGTGDGSCTSPRVILESETTSSSAGKVGWIQFPVGGSYPTVPSYYLQRSFEREYENSFEYDCN